MSRQHRAPRHPPSRPLSFAQKRALVALARSCAELGSEANAAAVSELSGLKPNAAVLALQGLVRRKLAVQHDAPETWSPTLSGRAMARYARTSVPRPAAGDGRRRKKWDR